MGILDEAIREHLELKRKHGAGDSELRELEDEAFGPPARPGEEGAEAPVLEAPTAVEAEMPPVTTEHPAVDLAEDAAEAPAEHAEPLPEAVEPVESVEEMEGPAEPAVEEHPAMEHPTVDVGSVEAETVRAETEEHPPPEVPEEPEGATIADQPTELYDHGGGPEAAEPVEDEFFSEQSLSDELDQALDAPESGLSESGEPGGEDAAQPPFEGELV